MLYLINTVIGKNIINNYLYYLEHGLKPGTSAAKRTNMKYLAATKYGQIDNNTKQRS